MNLSKSIATVACAVLCVYGVAANAADKHEPAMQHYVFKYNFNQTVHPMVKLMQETQQQVQYEVAKDVLMAAHGNLYATYDELNSMMTAANAQKAQQQTELAE